MTDISELVKRMRGLAEYVDDCDEAADALKAQAKEIKELETALNGWQQWWGLPWQDRRPDIAERCYRAASAALKGEMG